jgi:hypothetical protein
MMTAPDAFLTLPGDPNGGAANNYPDEGEIPMRMQWARVVVGVAALSGVGVLAGVSGAEAAPSGGIVHVFVEGTSTSNTAIQPIILTGAIADYGWDHSDIADNGNIDKVVLTKGTFWLNHAANGNTQYSLNPTTCYGTFWGTAPVVLSHGTGAYAGIKGTLSASLRDRVILPRMANGKCNESQNATSVVSLFAAQASGNVTFG